jgi:hypothetical protein
MLDSLDIKFINVFVCNVFSWPLYGSRTTNFLFIDGVLWAIPMAI